MRTALLLAATCGSVAAQSFSYSYSYYWDIGTLPPTGVPAPAPTSVPVPGPTSVPVPAPTVSPTTVAPSISLSPTVCSPTDNGAVDSFGDGCAGWSGYIYGWGCSGYYDDSDFSATMCCACDPYPTPSPTISSMPTPGPTTTSPTVSFAPTLSCDLAGPEDSPYEDLYGDGCDWWGYSGSGSYCDYTYWSDDDFTASEMCCACLAPVVLSLSLGVDGLHCDDCESLVRARRAPLARREPTRARAIISLTTIPPPSPLALSCRRRCRAGGVHRRARDHARF